MCLLLIGTVPGQLDKLIIISHEVIELHLYPALAQKTSSLIAVIDSQGVHVKGAVSTNIQTFEESDWLGTRPFIQLN